MKNIKHHLEVALAVKQTSCRKLADEWGVTDTHIWNIARGFTRSKVIRGKIIAYISEAQQENPLSDSIAEIAA